MASVQMPNYVNTVFGIDKKLDNCDMLSEKEGLNPTIVNEFVRAAKFSKWVFI